MGDRRGLSNTLGFVLLFGVIFVSILAVNTLGMAALEEGRDTTISMNAAASMESLSDAIDDLRVENTTTRLSVLRGASGTISAGDPTTVRISVTGASNPVYETQVDPIVYSFEDTEIVYEAGAVIRSQEGAGSVPIDEPPFSFNSHATILPIISTSAVDGGSVSADTVTVYLEKTGASLQHDPSDPGVVTTEIETAPERTGAWVDMLEGNFNDCGTTAPDTVRCTTDSVGSHTIIVREIAISYDLTT